MRLRPPTNVDAEAVLELIVARYVADLGVPEYTLADLRQEWGLQEVDLARDAVVVEEEDGSLVGYAIARSVGAQVIVPPEQTGRGIGSRLLSWAHERGGPRRQWVPERDVAGHELLGRAGYELVRHYWRMERDLAAPVEPPPPPEGIRLRALDPRADAEAVHALDAVAFATTPDYRPMSLAAFTEEILEAHDLDAAISLVAERDARLAGFLLTRRWEESVGYVDDLVVHPGEQGRGLGTALLLSAFAAFRAAGLRAAQLGVASYNARALRLYERSGMTQRFRFDVFERPDDQQVRV